MHIWVVSNPFALMSSFLLQSVLSPGWLQPLLVCPRSPVLGWVHTGGAQYSLTAETGEGKRRISWGSGLPTPLLLGCNLLSAPARAPLSLHLSLAPMGPWEGQVNITGGTDVA